MEEVLKIINPMTSTFIWTVIVFLILLLVLWKFVFKPINKTLTERRDHIRQNIDDAERQKDEAAKYIEEQKKILEDAKGEAKKIIEEGKMTAVKIKDDIEIKAHNRAQAMMHSAMEEIGSEREKSINQVRDRMVDIALSASEKVISKSLSEEEHKKLIDKAIEEIGKV